MKVMDTPKVSVYQEWVEKRLTDFETLSYCVLGTKINKKDPKLGKFCINFEIYLAQNNIFLSNALSNFIQNSLKICTDVRLTSKIPLNW